MTQEVNKGKSEHNSLPPQQPMHRCAKGMAAARHIVSHRAWAAKKRVWSGLERGRIFIEDGFRSQETTLAYCVEISRKGLQTFLKNTKWMLVIQPGVVHNLGVGT